MATPTFRNSPACLLAACGLLAGLPAQTQSSGLLAGAATTVMVDGGLAGANDAEAQVHGNGFSQAAPATFPPVAGAPNLAAILQQYGAPPGLDIDDISTGRDDLLIDNDGVLQVPINRWSVWSFSMRVGSQGAPGSRIAAQAAQGSVGSALFSYVLPGSNLPPQLLDRTERSHSRRELGIGGGSNTEVDGIDFPLGLGLDQQLTAPGGLLAVEPGFQALIQSPERIFFTVSHATRNLVPASWWQWSGFGATAPSGATILCTIKTSPSGFWLPPSVFQPFFTLGLGVDEDIDALAYDQVEDRLLYSVTGTLRDQFLFAYLGTDGPTPPAQPVTKPNGTPVSEAVGTAQNDDVDAVCTLDPQRTTGGGLPPGGDDFGSSCGAPRTGLFGVPQISGSAYRRYEGGQTHFDAFMVGWPPVAGVAPGFAACFLTTGLLINPILIGSIHVRNPANLIPGDPQSESFVVPPALSLTSFDATCRWIALDLATAELAEAWPVQVFL